MLPKQAALPQHPLCTGEACLAPTTIPYFQSKVDESWEKWWIPGLVPFGMKEE